MGEKGKEWLFDAVAAAVEVRRMTTYKTRMKGEKGMKTPERFPQIISYLFLYGRTTIQH